MALIEACASVEAVSNSALAFYGYRLRHRAGVRGRGGHVYFPRDSIPTWNECVKLLKEQRDRHLRRATAILRRLETELEAVGNDINEAREQPRQTLVRCLSICRPISKWPAQAVAGHGLDPIGSGPIRPILVAGSEPDCAVGASVQ